MLVRLFCLELVRVRLLKLQMLGKPSILVPLPNVSNNHQQYNAEVLASVGGAIIIKNEEINPVIVNEEVMKMLASDLAEMGEKARSVAVGDADEKIWEEVREIAARA